MIPESIYKKYDTLTLAQKLLGCTLVHRSKDGITKGKIVETEAYLQTDAASHAFRGKTQRNAPMFEQAGTIYVYLIYGIYECFNIVSQKKGIGEAILIRALEPIEGIELMQKRRKTNVVKQLCNGPGKLAMAMGFSRENNFESIFSDNIYCQNGKNDDSQIIQTTRIGITQAADLPYRFYLKDNIFVSKK